MDLCIDYAAYFLHGILSHLKQERQLTVVLLFKENTFENSKAPIFAIQIEVVSEIDILMAHHRETACISQNGPSGAELSDPEVKIVSGPPCN